MKNFKQFQEDTSKLPGLGGGGGGTDAITMKSPAKSAGKRIKDVGNLVKRPFRKKEDRDPRSKFATEEMMGGGAPTNNVGGGKIAGTVEAGDDPVVRKKKPTILARGKMPGARKRFKNGVDLINNIRN